MSNTTIFLFIFALTLIITGKGNCQSYCDVCQCDPSNSNPVVVQCEGSENLTSFPSNISNITISLYVAKLPITTLKTSNLAGLSALISLIIVDNKQLVTIETGAFMDLSKLPSINLRNNSLTALTGSALSGLQKLTEINVEHNMITALPDDICTALPSLETLRVSSNLLTTIGSGAFDGCTSIRHIDLSNNQITNIAEDAFQNLTSLTRIELKGNQLTSFYSAWIANKSSSFNLDIDSSMFDCSQWLKDEYDKMLQSHPQIIGCDTPAKFCPRCSNFGGRALANVTMYDLNPTTAATTQKATETTTIDANDNMTVDAGNSTTATGVLLVTGTDGTIGTSYQSGTTAMKDESTVIPDKVTATTTTNKAEWVYQSKRLTVFQGTILFTSVLVLTT